MCKVISREELARFDPRKAPVRTAASNQVYKRYFYLPRFMPYVGIEYGFAELDGGFIWKIPFDISFNETPATLITIRGYWEIPFIKIKVPLPGWVGEITSTYFMLYTLPVGTYRLVYIAVGPV